MNVRAKLFGAPGHPQRPDRTEDDVVQDHYRAPHDLDEATSDEDHRISPQEYDLNKALEKGGMYELPPGRSLVPPPQLPPRNKLDEIAELIRSLTYGEMMDLAGEIWNNREVGEFNEKELPQILHNWATGREHGKSQ